MMHCYLFLLALSGDEFKGNDIDIGSVLEPASVDLYFLNWQAMLHVRLERIFAMEAEWREEVNFLI